MKNRFLLLSLVLLLTNCIYAQETVGNYYNSTFQKKYNVQAILNSGDLKVYLFVEGYSSSDEVCFILDGEDEIISFGTALLAAKSKYEEWVAVAKQNNVTEMSKEMGISFPNIGVAWYGSKWWFDFYERISPYFKVYDTGECVCTIAGKATASTNEYIDQKYYLVLSSVDDFDNLYNALQVNSIMDALNSKQRAEDLFQ